MLQTAPRDSLRLTPRPGCSVDHRAFPSGDYREAAILCRMDTYLLHPDGVIEAARLINNKKGKLTLLHLLSSEARAATRLNTHEWV